MVKKIYRYFEVGDLLKVKTLYGHYDIFQRDKNGVRCRSRTIDNNQKVIYLGAKVCPTSDRPWVPNPHKAPGVKDEYIQVGLVSVKVVWEGAIWYMDCHTNKVFSVLKLVQRVHK